MGKPGAKPKRVTPPSWSSELAYACGLLVTDGCLYSDGRHINLTSVDRDQLETFKKCLGINNKIGRKSNGAGQFGLQVQFGDVTLYQWLISIGITPRKTFTLGEVKVPNQYFWDYLRGEFDGDGSSHAYWDTRWHSSVSLNIGFSCASINHLHWLNQTIGKLGKVTGYIRPGKGAYALLFSKTKARVLYQAMYYSPSIPYLKRKKEKLERQWQAVDLARQKQQPLGFVKGGSVLRIA